MCWFFRNITKTSRCLVNGAPQPVNSTKRAVLGNSMPGGENETFTQRAPLGCFEVLGWNRDDSNCHNGVLRFIPFNTGILDLSVDLACKLTRLSDLNLKFKDHILSSLGRQPLAQGCSQIGGIR